MPKRVDIKKILVIGSGPIIIGQAAEFDYAGTQACLALKEEGYEVILVNSNPATIMTDTEMADRVYIEPLTLEFLTRIIRKERPDAILPTLGGQTGLNLAVELSEHGILAECGVEVLGTKLSAIQKAEDRDLFRSLMNELNEPVPESEIIHSLGEAREFVERIGFPVIVRPAYTLGGTGGGICSNEDELKEIVENGLKMSPVHQCLLEKSIAGYKEIEYEVMRDSSDHAIVVCNMENIDPVGIHTGDSIVVAPSQTLSDREYQMLRNVSLKIIRALEIEGGCNVQLALDPDSFQYYIIEVNPRVSRSSALASKATGYPIAKLAAKIAVGLSLDEMMNPVTGKTYASFEPALDYVVSKIPRWPFDKFESANRRLGTQMKATGEVMAIGRTWEESLLKAVRSLEADVYHLELKDAGEISNEVLEKRIKKAGDERLFYLAEAFRRGYTVSDLHEFSAIDLFFLHKLEGIIRFEEKLKAGRGDLGLLKEAKELGFSDRFISLLWEMPERKLYDLRKEAGITPVYKMVDTCAAEFESETPYFYSTYEEENESVRTDKNSVIVLGSGPIRIGQGSNSTMRPCIRSGRLKKPAMKPLLSTTILRRFQQTSAYPTSSTLSRLLLKMSCISSIWSSRKASSFSLADRLRSTLPTSSQKGASPFSEHPLKIWTAPRTATSSNRRLKCCRYPSRLEKRRHLWKAPLKSQPISAIHCLSAHRMYSADVRWRSSTMKQSFSIIWKMQ